MIHAYKLHRHIYRHISTHIRTHTRMYKQINEPTKAYTQKHQNKARQRKHTKCTDKHTQTQGGNIHVNKYINTHKLCIQITHKHIRKHNI